MLHLLDNLIRTKNKLFETVQVRSPVAVPGIALLCLTNCTQMNLATI